MGSVMKDKKEENLHFLDYWQVIRSRKEIVLAVMLLIVLTGTGVTFLLPRIFMAETRILVRQDALDIDVFERQISPGFNPFFLRTEYETIQSKPILYQVIRNLDLQKTWGAEFNENGQPLAREVALRELAASLKVEQYRDTSLIAVKVYRKDNLEAARIANEVALVYKEQRLNLKRQEIKRAIDALKNELQKQQALVEEAEQKVESVRQELGVSMIGKGIQADKVRLSQLEADRISARVDMLVRKARLEQLENLEGDELMSASAYMVNDMNLMSVRKQLMDARVTLQLMLENYGENHPEVRRLRAAQDELQTQLRDSLVGLKRGLRADFEVAREKYNALETELELARKKDIESEHDRFLPFSKAERELEVQRHILEALQARVAQEGITLEVPRTPVEIVDPAEAPLRPVSPKLYLNIILSIILGLLAGVGLAYFIEYLDTSVKTVDDVENYMGLPVLGIIPQKVKPLNDEGVGSKHAESYRVLRTNMQFANANQPKGAFAAVSGGVGEGKSTTLFNLSYVTAQQGYKTLVVDSDLRRPVQHKILGMSNKFGLTNVLMRNVPLDEAIKPTTVPNLDFLPSGRLPRGSVALLDSRKMRDLVTELKKRYDCVYFDSPPLIGVSDASILASEVDGVLLVIQYRKYPRMISARAKQLIKNAGGNILGVVLNNINIMRDDYYYYYHSAYYQYYDSEENQTAEPAAPVKIAAKSY